MLDVHPPHEKTHTWTDFFIHIATIVVGLLIAVGLEQTVEWVHHQHQLHHMEEAVRTERRENHQTITRNLAVIDRTIAEADENLTRLEHAGGTPLVLVELDPRYIYALLDTAWLSMRDSNLIAAVPELVAANSWKIEYTLEIANNYMRDCEHSRDHISALDRLRKAAPSAQPADIAALRVAYSDYLQELHPLRNLMIAVDAQIELAEEDKPLSPAAVDAAMQHRGER